MLMITLTKINEENVKPIKIDVIPKEKIKGSNLFENIYANIFLVARKKSGKTSAIFKIIKSCTGKKTKVFIFASTVYKDPTWKHIVKYLKDRGNDVQTFTSIKEDNIDRLKEILTSLQVDDDSDDSEKDTPHNILFPPPKKERKELKLSPENIFVFDDMGSEISLSSV